MARQWLKKSRIAVGCLDGIGNQFLVMQGHGMPCPYTRELPWRTLDKAYQAAIFGEVRENGQSKEKDIGL
jgi:hypothetical protein